MTAPNKYRSQSQQRILQVLMTLAGNEFNGVLPGALAHAVNTTASNITRDLANLSLAGLAEEIPDTGRWRLGPKVVQLALAHLRHMDDVERRHEEVKQRYSRTPT